MGCGGCRKKRGEEKNVDDSEPVAAVAEPPGSTKAPKVKEEIRLIRVELCKQCSEMVLDEDGAPTTQYLPGEWEGRLHCGNPSNPATATDAERYGCGCAVEDRAQWHDATCPRNRWGPGHRFRNHVIPMFISASDKTLPGVIDYIGPTRTLDGINDCAGIGDVMVQGVVVQAIQRYNAERGYQVRFITVGGRTEWAEMSAPGIEVWALEDLSRVRGEHVQHSAPLRALEIDATCRMQGQNRHQFLASQFGVPEEYITDWRININDEATKHAEDFLAIPKKDGRPIICISPHANSPTRQYPLRHWCQLVERLKKDGHAVFILHRPIPPGTADPIKTIPCRRFGSNDPHRVAAVVAQSDIVIGADSGMAHLAGILRKPALAVCGPTEGATVFGGWPTVRYIQAPGPCTGCLWFQDGGWKPWCGFGCEALADLKPRLVQARAMGILKEIGRL